MGIHQDRLFRSMYRALEAAKSVSSEALCQLYEIHRTLEACHNESYKAYELDDDTARGLHDHYKRQKGRIGRHLRSELPTEKISTEVAEVLKSVVDAPVSVAHQTSLGFSVILQ